MSKTTLNFINNHKGRKHYFNQQQKIDLLSTERKWSGKRLQYYGIEHNERKQLQKIFEKYDYARNLRGQNDEDTTRTLAVILSNELERHAPKLALKLKMMRNTNIDAFLVNGLPMEKQNASLIILTLSYLLGEPMQYAIDGATPLIECLLSSNPRKGKNKRKGVPNHYGRKVEYLYSPYATFPQKCRPEWLTYYAVANESGVEIPYAPILDVYDNLTMETRLQLLEHDVSFQVPEYYGFPEQKYISHGPVLSATNTGEIEVALPKSPSYVYHIDSFGLTKALKELMSVLMDKMRSFRLKPGSFLAVNNYRGVHGKPRKYLTDSLTLKTLVIKSYEALEYATEEEGPIFSPLKILTRHVRSA